MIRGLVLLACLSLAACNDSAANNPSSDQTVPDQASPAPSSSTEPVLTHPASAAVVRLSSIEVPMVPDDEDELINGRLRYLGGIVLRGNHEHFSGLSGLRFIEDDTAFLAVNDRGNWVTFTPRFRGERLVDVERDGFIWAILNEGGLPVADPFHDSESLEIVGTTAYVGFERRHRIDSFENILSETNPIAVSFRSREVFGEREFNGSLESLTVLDDHHLLSIAESANDDSTMDAWIMDMENGETEQLSILAVDPFSITDMATLPDGDVITLERRYSPLTGVGARLRLIKADTIVPGALLDGEELARFGANHTVDNMEGLAIREIDGRVEIFIISDNNQNPLQRNLLMAFELMPGDAAN